MRRSGLQVAALVSAATLCSACGVPTGPPGFVFSQAIEVPEKIPHVLWLERIAIEPALMPEQELLETALTYSFARVLRQKKLFKAVKIESGAAAPDDWILSLRIERCVQRGRIPLAAYVLAPLTFGLYVPVGRIQELDFEMAGRFEVRDGAGKLVGSGEASHTGKLDVYQKNLTNAFSFYMDERSRFADELLDRLVTATGAQES